MPRNPLMPSFAELRKALLGVGVIPADMQRRNSPNVDVEGAAIPDVPDPQQEGRPAYLPYRGGEMHGVPTPNPLEEDAEGYSGGTVDVFNMEEMAEHVLPVRIVNPETGGTYINFHVDQFIVPSDRVIQIVSRLRSRKTLRIRNLNQGGNRVWVAATREVAQSGMAGGGVHSIGAYPIMGNSQETFSTTEAMYAIATGPNLDGSAQVVLYWEYEETA